MEITKNDVKYNNNGQPVKREVTYSDPYKEVRETYFIRNGIPILTDVKETKKP